MARLGRPCHLAAWRRLEAPMLPLPRAALMPPEGRARAGLRPTPTLLGLRLALLQAAEGYVITAPIEGSSFGPSWSIWGTGSFPGRAAWLSALIPGSGRGSSIAPPCWGCLLLGFLRLGGFFFFLRLGPGG